MKSEKTECLEKDLYEIFTFISGLFIFENEEGNLCPGVSKQKCYYAIKEIQKMFSQRQELVDIANKYLSWERHVFKINSNSYWNSVIEFEKRIRNKTQQDVVAVVEKTESFIYDEKYELPFMYPSVECMEDRCVINFHTRTNDKEVLYDILTANTRKKRCTIKDMGAETYCIATLMTPEKEHIKCSGVFPYYSISFQIEIYT